jgi:hypothetical protein
MISERVQEVRELAVLLEGYHLHKGAALRTAIECVYGKRKLSLSNDFSKEEVDEIKEKAWKEAFYLSIQE